MKPNKWMILGIAAFIIICGVKAYAGNLSMRTYYPAPTGYYDQVKVNKALVIPCYRNGSASIPTNVGAVWFVDTSVSGLAGCNN